VARGVPVGERAGPGAQHGRFGSHVVSSHGRPEHPDRLRED